MFDYVLQHCQAEFLGIPNLRVTDRDFKRIVIRFRFRPRIRRALTFVRRGSIFSVIPGIGIAAARQQRGCDKHKR
ncbi:hypothetical protein D3C74_313010 [compost metagenome]